MNTTSAGTFVMIPVKLFGAVPPRAIGVYAGLRSFWSPGRPCHPTAREIADVLGVSVDTVQRALPRLIAAKAVTVTKRRGRRTAYRFISSQQWAEVPTALLGRVGLAEIGLYAVLRSYDGEQGCFPKADTIASRAGISNSQAREYMYRLAQCGAINVIGRVNRHERTTSNMYVFADPVIEVAADSGTQRPQIPAGGSRRSRQQTRTKNQNQDLELVGWSAPAARCQPLAENCGQLANNLASPGHDSAAPGHNLAAPGEHRAALRDTGPRDDETATLLGHSAAESSRTGMTDADRSREVGWISKPLPDPIVEAHCAALVDLLADGQVTSGRNAPAPATLDAWTASARRMLAHDERDYEKAHRLIQDVCADRYWSGRVRNMFDVADRFDEIAAEFARRKPIYAGAERAKRRRDRQADKRVTDAGTRETDRAAGLGGISLSRLSVLLDATPASTETTE